MAQIIGWRKIIYILVFFGISLFSLKTGLISKVFAQDSSLLNISNTVPIKDKVEDGDVIVTDAGVNKKSTKIYDSNLLGVVSWNSAISFGSDEATPSSSFIPVASSGNALVKVTNENGAIAVGDLITTSSKPGVAMKSTREGYVLGAALNNYNESGVGKIMVSINVRPYYGESLSNRNFWEIFNLARLAMKEGPLTVFRYLLASVVVILSCIAGFVLFGRIAASGVEAVARNPLVGRKIQFSVILNTIITLAIMGAGGIVAYLILKA